MVVVDGPDGLIPTFNWIYPSLIKTRKKKKKKTLTRKKKRKLWIYHRLPLFHFLFLWYKSGL